MKYPKWFPRPSAWLSAIKLFIPTYLLGTIALSLFFWSLLITSIMVGVAGSSQASLFLALFALIAFVGSFVFYVVIKAVYRLILSLLWNIPPRWLSPDKWTKTLHHFLISSVATLPIATAFLVRVASKVSLEQMAIESFADYDTDAIDSAFENIWLWIICAAYSYHVSAKPKSKT